jgi:hypothetical protein
MAQVVELLLCKGKGLSSKPSPIRERDIKQDTLYRPDLNVITHLLLHPSILCFLGTVEWNAKDG